MPKLVPVDWRTLDAVFLRAGFEFKRQEGSHRSYVKPGVARPIVIPTYAEVPVFIIRNNLRTADLSREDPMGWSEARILLRHSLGEKTW